MLYEKKQISEKMRETTYHKKNPAKASHNIPDQ